MYAELIAAHDHKVNRMLRLKIFVHNGEAMSSSEAVEKVEIDKIRTRKNQYLLIIESSTRLEYYYVERAQNMQI